MLLIQTISLDWGKTERGAQFAKARRNFPQTFPIETIPEGEVVLHTLNFYQQGTSFLDDLAETRQSLEKALPRLGFSPERIQQEVQERNRHIQQYRIQVFPSASALNLTNLDIQPCENGYAVSFFYDEHRSGMPFRRGHNQDYTNPQSPLYCKDCLNELAFHLLLGQYGRILWNERKTDSDTGQWYYLIHIYNIYFLSGRPTADLLSKNKPDFVYKQLAELF